MWSEALTRLNRHVRTALTSRGGSAEPPGKRCESPAPDAPAVPPFLMVEEENNWSDIAILPRSLGMKEQVDERERRALLVMQAGARLIGVFADEADSVTEGLIPTPLPHAPPAVLGVVSVRGRMRTVLDPLALLDGKQDAGGVPVGPPRFIVSLRGDEQLALAVERVDHIIEIFTESVESLSHTGSVVRGVVQYEGALVVVLDPEQLFKAAVEGTERRRQR